MFKYFEPNKIFSITSRAPKYVLLVFIIILCIGLTEALILSPEDYKQSHSVRIMYVHVPAAWISLGIFSIITFLSIAGYIFKLKNFFLISKSLAPSGLVFNIIALVTGIDIATFGDEILYFCIANFNSSENLSAFSIGELSSLTSTG